MLNDSKKIRVAVLFFGQPRYVDSGLAALSHKFALRKYKVKYFGHTWFDPSNLVVETAAWTGSNWTEISPKAISSIKKHFRNIRLQVESPRVFSGTNLLKSVNIVDKPSAILKKEIDNLPNILSQFYSLSKAFSGIEEELNNFDFLIVSRFDNFIWRIPNLRKLDPQLISISNHHPKFPDLIFLSKPNNLLFLNCFDDLDKICHNQRDLSAENIKLQSLLRFHDPKIINPVYTDVAIIRNRGRLKTSYVLLSQKIRRTLQIRTRLIQLLHRID